MVRPNMQQLLHEENKHKISSVCLKSTVPLLPQVTVVWSVTNGLEGTNREPLATGFFLPEDGRTSSETKKGSIQNK